MELKATIEFDSSDFADALRNGIYSDTIEDLVIAAFNNCVEEDNIPNRDEVESIVNDTIGLSSLVDEGDLGSMIETEAEKLELTDREEVKEMISEAMRDAGTDLNGGDEIAKLKLEISTLKQWMQDIQVEAAEAAIFANAAYETLEARKLNVRWSRLKSWAKLNCSVFLTAIKGLPTKKGGA